VALLAPWQARMIPVSPQLRSYWRRRGFRGAAVVRRHCQRPRAWQFMWEATTPRRPIRP